MIRKFQQIVTLLISVTGVNVLTKFFQNGGMDLDGYSVSKIGHQLSILKLH